jgi:uncharacterized membrane protein
VSYKIHGFLKDSSKYFSTVSLLNANVMDVLHARKIEIVSPTFMNQRNANEQTFIPKLIPKNEIKDKEQLPEDLVFDEAIKSENNEKKKDQIEKLNKQQELLRAEKKKYKSKDEIQQNKLKIKNIEKLKTKVEKSIDESDEKEN